MLRHDERARYQKTSFAVSRLQRKWHTRTCLIMSNDPEELRRQEFLERAKDAEDRAARTHDPHLRDSWMKVAEGYRDLARRR